MKATATKWNLDREVKLNHKVVEAVWQQDRGQWKLTVEADGRIFTHYAHILVSGQGVLK